MQLTETRIDDRLVHGQIVTAWVQELRAQAIIVADDAAAADSFQQTILRMAAPEQAQLIIKSVIDAAELIKKDESNVRVLLIVRSASDALRLLECGVEIERITLGNITNKKDGGERKTVLKYVFASQQDADALLAISEKGVTLVAQSVPSEKAHNVMEAMKKAGFYN